MAANSEHRGVKEEVLKACTLMKGYCEMCFHSKDIIKLALGREVKASRHKYDVAKSYILARLTELQCKEQSFINLRHETHRPFRCLVSSLMRKFILKTSGEFAEAFNVNSK